MSKEDELDKAITDALTIATRVRDEAAKGERGRQISLVITKLEEALLWTRSSATFAKV